MKLIMKAIFLFLLVPIALVSVRSEDQCMERLRAVYNKLAEESARSESGTCLYLKYSLTVISREPRKVANRSAQAEIYTNSSFTRVYTDGIQMLQDKSDIVVIQPERKMLFVRSAPPREMQKLLFDDFLIMRDSLFSMLDIKSCTVVAGVNGRQERVIYCEIKPSRRVECAYRTLTFRLDAETWSLRGVEVGYPSGVPIASVAVVFTTIERRSVPAEFTGSVTRAVVSASGEAVGKYKGYTVLDQRSKTTK